MYHEGITIYYIGVIDKVLWHTKWHSKVLCGPMFWATLVQSRASNVKIGSSSTVVSSCKL